MLYEVEFSEEEFDELYYHIIMSPRDFGELNEIVMTTVFLVNDIMKRFNLSPHELYWRKSNNFSIKTFDPVLLWNIEENLQYHCYRSRIISIYKEISEKLIPTGELNPFIEHFVNTRFPGEQNKSLDLYKKFIGYEMINRFIFIMEVFVPFIIEKSIRSTPNYD